MPKETTVTAITGYLDKVRTTLARARGELYHGLFIDNNDGAFTFDTGAMVKRVLAVDSTADLDACKQSSITNEYIFNSWQRISRGNWHATNPPSKESVGFSDNAIPGDITGFAYDSSTGQITSEVDTLSMVGFVSPDAFDTYTLDVTLKSTSDWQNDPLGLLLGYVRDPDGTTHTLTVFRAPYACYSGLNSAMQVAVDYNTIGGIAVANQNNGLLWVDGSPATGPSPTADDLGGVAPHAYKPWVLAPNGIQLRVTRSGDNFTIETSNYDVPGLVPAATLNFTLNDHPSLARFRGPAPVGYVAISQDNAIWEVQQSPIPNPVVVNLLDRTAHTYTGSTWEVSAAGFGDHIKNGRMYFNNITRKAFHVDLVGVPRRVRKA